MPNEQTQETEPVLWSAGDIAKFPLFLAEKGYMNESTAKAQSRAVEAVVVETEGQEDWQSHDLSNEDVDELLERFEQKALSRRTLKPDSISTYQSRCRKALDAYTVYQRDGSVPRSAKRTRSKSSKKGSGPAENGHANGNGDQSNGSRQPSTMIEYPFPVRRGLRAWLVLPEDLTAKEAKKLADFVNTLAVEEPAEIPAHTGSE